MAKTPASHFIINWVLCSMKNSKEPVPNGIVRFPRIFLALPLAGMSLFAIPITLIILESWSAKIIVPAILFILNFGLFMYFLVWRIKFDDYQFTNRNMFLYSRTCKYVDITDVKKDRDDTIVFVGKRKIRVPIEAAGASPFLRIVPRYKKHK